MDVNAHESSSKEEWRLAYVMPNLMLHQSFEFGDVALVGGEDPRLDVISQKNAAASVLLNGFANHLPSGRRPAAQIYRPQSGIRNLLAAIIDARNAVAVASSCYGWICSIGRQQFFGIRDTDHFDLYRRWPSDDGKHLVYHGPAWNLVSSNLDGFRGETHPYLSVTSFSRVSCDEELMSMLMRIWHTSHVKGRESRKCLRLFRALSVAYEACRVPQSMDNSLYDHGKHCSLWVSAFETLAHPGTYVGLKQVLDLIGKRHLDDRRLKRKSRMLYRGRPLWLNAAQRLYFWLYRARNDFLHGNKLSTSAFVPRCLENGVRLLDAAPVVFHAALEGMLQPSCTKNSSNGAEDIATFLGYRALEDAFARALAH